MTEKSEAQRGVATDAVESIFGDFGNRLPPSEPGARYPVLYLLHGAGSEALGRHRLLVGDATQKEAVARLTG